MQIRPDLHLTYCANIHSGESWEDTFIQLKKNLPSIKQAVSPNAAFGIGLRLSALAASELEENPFKLSAFKEWLNEEDCYVFTLNGFPYGRFHHQKVKDQVHAPDWTIQERIAYTASLIRILAFLLPKGLEGGISTSPLSYRHWWKTQDDFEKARWQATQNILSLVPLLDEIHSQQQTLIHLDIEPEPDGMIENATEFLNWYEHILRAKGIPFLQNTYSAFAHTKETELKRLIQQHICLCYDVCHFAVAFENHAEVLQKLARKEIKIGKFQISSALKVNFTGDAQVKQQILKQLERFDESTYLHQAIGLTQQGDLIKFPDLKEALAQMDLPHWEEFRIHFHVPIFLDKYEALGATQSDIKEILNLSQNTNWSHHWEVETYTWEVLPAQMRVPIQQSIIRELEWVVHHFKPSF